jgi:hypothetical protein
MVLLIGAGASVLARHEGWAAGLALAGLAAHLLTAANWRRGLLALVPVLLFASVLAALGRVGGSGGWLPAVKTVAVFTFVVSAARLAPGETLLLRVGPDSWAFRGALFLLMVRHFAAIFGQEAWRLLVAHRLAAPRRWRREWFASLGWATAAVLQRALVRAERFYAAARLRGLGE